MTGAINEPHPNDAAVADPADFFAEPDADEPQDQVEAEEPEAAVVDEAEPETEPDTEPTAEPVDAVVVEPAAEPADTEAAADATEPESEEDDKGNKREYVILQEIVLDLETLQDMVKNVKGGVEPVVALVEVHRADVTTQKAALSSAWKVHKEAWEAPPRLAAVSANKLKVRTVKIKTREVTGFDFE